MPWNEIYPERVPDRETVSFRFRVIDDAIANAWKDALKLPGPRPRPAQGSPDSRTVRIGVGLMEGDVKESPQWWHDAWLTRNGDPYEGGVAEELTATAPIGPRAYAFDEPEAPIWVVLDFQWTPAGSFVQQTDDPPWTENLLDPSWRRNSPPVTVPEPDTHDPTLAGIQRVWLRENPQELWCSGIYGWGRRLHSFAVEESAGTVNLTCLLGTTAEYESAVERANRSGVAMVVPAMAYVWTTCSPLAAPLGERRVYFRSEDR